LLPGYGDVLFEDAGWDRTGGPAEAACGRQK